MPFPSRQKRFEYIRDRQRELRGSGQGSQKWDESRQSEDLGGRRARDDPVGHLSLYSADNSYEFDTYKKFSLAFYTVLMGYADELQAVSVDEALIDVTSAVMARASVPEEAPSVEQDGAASVRDPAIEVAEKIRDEVRGLTQGCEGESLRHWKSP
jgi:hypothetical protein